MLNALIVLYDRIGDNVYINHNPIVDFRKVRHGLTHSHYDDARSAVAAVAGI